MKPEQAWSQGGPACTGEEHRVRPRASFQQSKHWTHTGSCAVEAPDSVSWEVGINIAAAKSCAKHLNWIFFSS